MKIFINFISILFVICSQMNAQRTVEFIYDNDSSEVANSSFETNSGCYIALGLIRDKYSTVIHNSALIIEFDEYSILKSRSFFKQDSSISFSYGFQKSNNNYFIVGNMRDSTQNGYSWSIYLCEIDTEFNILWEKYYPVPEGYMLMLGDIVVDQWEQVVIFSSLKIPPYSTKFLHLSKFDMEGNLLKSNFLPNHEASFYDDMLLNQDGTGYQIIGRLNINGGLVRDYFEIDTALNVCETGMIINGGGSLNFTASGKWQHEEKLVICNTKTDSNTGAFHDLFMLLVDQQLNVIKDTVIFDQDAIYTPVHKGMDFLYEDLIWTCTFDYNIANFQSNHVFKVYLFGSELNVLGVKTFGGDSHWWLTHLRATTDGGCIITGMMREKEGTNLYETNAYILKVMPEDLITSAKDRLGSDNAEIVVFPNPFRDKLFIRGIDSDMQAIINSIDGRRLITMELSSNTQTIINTSSLNSGIYFYKIVDDNKTVKSGKLIKQ